MNNIKLFQNDFDSIISIFQVKRSLVALQQRVGNV